MQLVFDTKGVTFMKNQTLFSVGELAKSLHITRKIILNYEAKGLIQPDKKEGATGNRYYTIDTFTKIRTIRIFQELGLSLDEILDYFNKSSDLQPIIDKLEHKRDTINLAIEKLKQRNRKQDQVISEVTIEPQTVYCRIYNSPSITSKTNLLRDTALEAMKTYGTDITKQMYYTEFSTANPSETFYCVAVPPESNGKYINRHSALKALSFFHHGPYEELPAAREKLISYANDNHITLSGVFRHVYFEGPPQHSDKNRFITQVLAIIE